MFSVQVRQEALGSVFTLRGDLDFESMVQLQEAGEREVVRGRAAGPVVVDCSGLAFCDSSGINALVRLFRQLDAQDRVLRLAAVPDSVARLLSLTGLDQVFAVHDDAEHALNAETERRDIVAADRDGAVQERQRI
ncbi:STAS domain-containing protein [Streptomyces seoulensis]